MAHRPLFSFSLVSVITIVSTAMFAVAASASRALDAFVTFALTAFDPAPQVFLDRPATETPRVLGLPETRSFVSRLLMRAGPDLSAGHLSAVA